jgi:NAD(P)-dependent dehydrogenase (short-subunit alcohol dehydrogenase family)
MIQDTSDNESKIGGAIMLLKGKYVIVSGFGPGLGAKLAYHAALEGAAGVAIGGRKPEKVAHVKDLVSKAGTGCKIVTALTDICYPEQCNALAEAAIDAFGRIDALLNNAYYHGPSLFDAAATADFADWIEQYSTNVIGTLKMTQAVLPQMKAQGAGSVVMINTMGSKMVPIVDEAGYCASKAALYNVSRKLAREVGKDNIRVNSLHPGFMWGVPVQNAMPIFADKWGGEEKAIEKIKSYNALPRITTDDEVARAALFLASDYASAVTGASLDANGGAFLP